MVCIADASNLERNLYFLTQVLELGLPTILVLNMIDVAEQKSWRIDIKKLSEILGVPVVTTQATTGKGLLELRSVISREDLPPPKWHSAPLPADIREALCGSRDEAFTALVRSGSAVPVKGDVVPLTWAPSRCFLLKLNGPDGARQDAAGGAAAGRAS